MPIQDHIGTYSAKMDPAYAGMVADASMIDVQSAQVETAEVAFGLAVGTGTADGSVKKGGTGFVGVTVADKSRDADKYDVGEMAGVARKGTIWVVADGAIADTDTPAFTPATGAITKAGTGKTTIANARFLDSVADGALVRLYIG